MKLIDDEFIEAMAEVMREGADRPGRVLNGWRDLEWTVETEKLYYAKLIGHAAQAMRPCDLNHLAAAACNALIIWYHRRIEEG
jgi:hypothetical protein